ncbi:hypothetical protein DL766_008494 [Monosporascus sp. MC13-8B]|nr:hypothetical protein DL766_008494 [Monosporascus sp. MC13-8B]
MTSSSIFIPRDNSVSTSVTQLWVTVGVILAAIVGSSIILYLILLYKRTRRAAKTLLPYDVKRPRQWLRRQKSVQEILEDVELERITQIRKSTATRASYKSSRSSQTPTMSSTVSSDSAYCQEHTETLRDDSKDFEARLQGSAPTSIRDLEAQGHPAFSSRLSRLDSSGVMDHWAWLAGAQTRDESIEIPARGRPQAVPQQDISDSPPRPPPPVRVVDKEARRERSRSPLLPPYERVD